MKYVVVIILMLFLFPGCEQMILGPEQDNNPKNNFEILWKELDQNYPLFIVKNINWDSLHAFYSSQILPQTTEAELWDLTTRMLSTLDDGHISIYNKGITKWFGITRKADEFSLNLLKDKLLENVKVVGAGLITYGKVKGQNIGYIYIASFASNSGNGVDWAYDINKAVNDLYNSDALIIDLRNNGGGLKVTGKIIVSAFVDHQFTYFYQREKIGPGHNDFGSPIPLIASPGDNIQRFTKKIALLTNRLSASGSEHFAQAFKFLSYTKQIGDTTFGAFGDIINTGTLPNGWTFKYPCRLTTTPEGKCYEGIGIIPEILVENSKADINAGRDNVFNSALKYLNGN